jgi:hypothetical protein
MSFSDAQVRSIALGMKAFLDTLGAGNIGARGNALLVALEAIGGPTAAPGDPGAPPPTSPFPPTSDPTKGAAEVIRRAAYAPGFSAEWALVSDLGNGKITYRQVP